MKGKKTASFSLKDLKPFLWERFHPFNVKSFLILAGIIIPPVLLSGVLILAWMSTIKIKDVVTLNFNQQQLVLAQHAAGQIENSINILKRELSLLSFSPSIQYDEEVFMGKRMDIAFSSIKDEGGLEIRFVKNKDKKTIVANSRGYNLSNPSADDLYYLKQAGREENKGKISLSDVSAKNYKNSQKLIITMALSVWQISVDVTHPVAANKFSGVLLFIIDATALAGETTKNIISGNTGYAWVIDRNGTFLYHPEKWFIGKNAFEVRKAKKPAISFARINTIQREKMLKGMVGTSWYISGWHRGKEGEMKKLIAYAPIPLDNTADNRIWSVAVVAPISEVEGVIHEIQIRQFYLEGFTILTIFFGGLLIVSLMLVWSSSLQKEVKNKTSELIKSESQYKSLIEHANDIIFTVTHDGEIISMNHAGRTFFKRDDEEIVGDNIGEICFNEDSASLQLKAIDDVFKAARLSRQITYPVIISGNKYWLSTNFSALLDDKGEVFAVLGIARDFTERKKIEEQMSHTEKLASLGTLAAGVAHEINNPLTIILGFTDLLKEKVPAYSEYYEILKTIEKQGLNAKRVVENLLTFARFSEYKEENVDINMNLKEVLTIVGNTLSLNKVAIVEELSESLPIVKGDPRELQQVFLNIVNNAISAMKGGGTLTIAAKMIDEGGAVEIKISDTGSGIKKEYSTRIFDPLFTTKKVGEGTGLGLSVSYGIIAKYGGTITFETMTKEESSKTGTTFIITLPAVKAGNSQ
ncbi:MAG: PAS domain S-box protein [Nitrospirae bacterium]|nr:PAS domain S-box protein [Nitrospirota bacterium]